MKYGIKHTTGVIDAISTFPNDVVPGDFTEITEAKYNEFLLDLELNPYCTYDTGTNKLVKDSTKYNDLIRSNSKEDLRLQLKDLSIEIDLQERMGEDTTATQADFDAKKTQYDAL